MLDTSPITEDNEDWAADSDCISPEILLTRLRAEDRVGSAVISDSRLETIPLAWLRTDPVEVKASVS
jgi:hypothetical protein